MDSDMATVIARELIDYSRELHLKSTPNNLGETSKSSLQVEAFSEDSEAPSVTVKFKTKCGVLVTSAVEVLHLFLLHFSSEAAIQTFGSDKVLPAQLICKKVILYASKLSRISGKDENIVMYLEQVTEYMEKNPGVGSAELRCLLLYACAKVFKKHGRMDKALQSCNSAREATRLIANEVTKILLEIAISLLLVEINGFEGDPEDLVADVIGFLKSQHLFLGWINVVGFIREIPAVVARDPRMAIFKTDALVAASSTDQGERSCGAVLLSLSDYYNWTRYPYRHHASLILAEQAILGLQREKCTCRSDYVVYPSVFYRVEECACHQLLADAWGCQGLAQWELGLSEMAEQSFQQGLKLSQSCEDKDREYAFHVWLAFLLLWKTQLRGLITKDGFSHDSWAQDTGTLIYHLKNYFKIIERPEDSPEKDIAISILKNLASCGPTANSLEHLLDSLITTCLENSKRKERSGDLVFRASTHAELSSLYLRRGLVSSAREHFLLGLKYWKEGGCADLFYSGQILGLIALRPEIMELDHAFYIWYTGYNRAQSKLEDISRISEEDALHYFETVKHTTMWLAKCEMLKYRKLHESFQSETFEQIRNRNPLEAEEYALLALTSLMWAERGKGKMLMSYIGAIQKNSDTKVEDSEQLERLGLPSDYPLDFESHFSTNDPYALLFLLGRPKTSEKVIFIEYTFIDSKHLMIHVSSDLEDVFLNVEDLSVVIDPKTRDEAEKELDLLRKPSPSNVGVGSQQFTGPNTAGTTSSRKLHDTLAQDEKMTQAIIQEASSGAESANKVLSAMNKYGTNRIPFNRWIPGMVAGIQRRVSKVQLLRKKTNSILIPKLDREIRQLLQTLYRILIKPVEDCLFMHNSSATDIATLVFVPHEDLGVVPFAALHERDGSPFLIERFAISISPAIWCFRHCEYLYDKKVRSDQGEGTPLLVGRKSGYKPPFQDLAEAHKEVEAVCEIMSRSAARCKKVLDDSDCPDLRSGMKECVKEYLPNASWIHFSVHGEISPQFPQGSLLFGDNDGQRLTANEIITSAASTPWRGRCAVASACQSGLGSVAGGGIMGFARSFIVAGIPSCVLSMWEVNESFCTSFMEKLYCNLQSGETLGHAMRNTMLCMMKEPVESYTSVSSSATQKKKRQSKRFTEPETPDQPPESGEPMWSILDWAAFSCFGFPGVKLVADAEVAKSTSKGKSPTDESAHAQHQEVVRHQEEFSKVPMRQQEIANQADGSAAESSFGELSRWPERRKGADCEIANLAAGSVDGANPGGFIRQAGPKDSTSLFPSSLPRIRIKFKAKSRRSDSSAGFRCHSRAGLVVFSVPRRRRVTTTLSSGYRARSARQPSGVVESNARLGDCQLD